MAKELREFCQKLIRERLKNKSDRQKLADALGLSVSAVESLAYQGSGSFDTYAGALLSLYGLDPELLKSFIVDFKEGMRKISPSTESDKMWFDLPLTEEERRYWLMSIRATVRINLAIYERKKKAIQAAKKT